MKTTSVKINIFKYKVGSYVTLTILSTKTRRFKPIRNF